MDDRDACRVQIKDRLRNEHPGAMALLGWAIIILGGLTLAAVAACVVALWRWAL